MRRTFSVSWPPSSWPTYPGGAPNRREAVKRSWNSPMSIWMRSSSEPKRNSASALDSSVLPTPDGPAKMKEPDGRFGSFRPARVRRIARETDLTAWSWPMMRLCSSSSMRSRRLDSFSVSLSTGMPVQCASTSAISSSPTSAISCRSPDCHSFSFSERSSFSLRSVSRRLEAFSKSWASIAASFSVRISAMRSSMSRSPFGAVMRLMRMRAPASSKRSTALSGRKRSLM